MPEINFNTVIDVSSIIWDKNDFNLNKSDYYNLIYEVTKLIEKTKKLEFNILIRNELLEQMTIEFPFDHLPNEFYEFGNIVYTFLANLGSNYTSYSDNILNGLVSNPNQVKTYFNQQTKEEMQYLISKMHSGDEAVSKYFTFKYLWNGNNNLITNTVGKTNTYETILVDVGTQLDDFLEKLIPRFEHNPKHDKTPYNTKAYWESAEDKDGFPSRLSCYNGIDNDYPDKILSKRYPSLIDNCYFGYDNENENEVFVVFRRTHINRNIFHGYDENNLNNIPQKVRKHFNK